ncbi:MAG: hypothetical protein DME22_08160 [Verrucomicrobia bacterium]|nr:MAG: hypothetical protein DME22_08160 [Verrucomicrobiota bacterium]
MGVGDFNGDGKPDLAVTSYNSSNFSVLLGNGDGTFQTAVNYGAGFLQSSVAIGDFNSDGKSDLAVADYGSAYVWVLLGKGDGTFQAATKYDAGSASASLSVSDFNGDGKVDLAVAILSGNVSILLGNGDGTFQAAMKYGTATAPSFVAVGDFNGDGKPDLAVANIGYANAPGTNISVLLGNGDGTFRAAVNYGTGIGPASVAVGDFNGDGKPDLAVANTGPYENFTYTGGDVSVLLGNGDGTFQAAVNYNAGIGPGSVSVGDLNGDGKTDLAVVNSGSVSVLLGNGDGTFQSAFNYAAGRTPVSVLVGDFNGDGKPDLAVANNFTSGGVSILLNACTSAGIDLTVVRTRSNTVTVSWPFPSTGFVLESTTNLTLMNWQRAVEMPATNNARLEVTVSADQQERYFRLHKP